MPSSRLLFQQIDEQIRLIRIAYLEHELLDGPYQHTDLCKICFPDH